jgi:hypothetical protein
MTPKDGTVKAQAAFGCRTDAERRRVSLRKLAATAGELQVALPQAQQSRDAWCRLRIWRALLQRHA